MRNFNLRNVKLLIIVITVVFIFITLVNQVDDALASMMAFFLKFLFEKFLNNVILKKLLIFFFRAWAFNNAYNLNSLSVSHELHAFD